MSKLFWLQKVVKFSLSDNVQGGTKTVSDNGAVREDTVQKQISSYNHFQVWLQRKLIAQKVEMSELGGATFWCLPLTPSPSVVHISAADQH